MFSWSGCTSFQRNLLVTLGSSDQIHLPFSVGPLRVARVGAHVFLLLNSRVTENCLLHCMTTSRWSIWIKLVPDHWEDYVSGNFTTKRLYFLHPRPRSTCVKKALPNGNWFHCNLVTRPTEGNCCWINTRIRWELIEIIYFKNSTPLGN